MRLYCFLLLFMAEEVGDFEHERANYALRNGQPYAMFDNVNLVIFRWSLHRVVLTLLEFGTDRIGGCSAPCYMLCAFIFSSVY